MQYTYEDIKRKIHEIDELEQHLTDVVSGELKINFYEKNFDKTTQLKNEFYPYDLDHFKNQYVKKINERIDSLKAYVKAILK